MSGEGAQQPASIIDRKSVMMVKLRVFTTVFLKCMEMKVSLTCVPCLGGSFACDSCFQQFADHIVYFGSREGGLWMAQYGQMQHSTATCGKTKDIINHQYAEQWEWSVLGEMIETKPEIVAIIGDCTIHTRPSISYANIGYTEYIQGISTVGVYTIFMASM